ncbi:uncharacterized protein [Amphiura filiformis]|uniref:uncharacterized protein n=1 Tax=Amphiura filiformis TaxID=82378 RepID=UPI003B219435
MFITETWLNQNDNVVIGECSPPGYSFVNVPRGTSDHGGIAIISKSSLKLHTVQLQHSVTTFESASVIDPAYGIQYIVIYRPPHSKKNGLLTSTFLNEFEDFMGEIALFPNKVVLLGDFNVHVNKPWKSDVRRFLTCLEVSGFHQHVNQPTHRSGNILDLIISRPEDNLVHNCLSQGIFLPDHSMVHCYLNRKRPPQTKKPSRVRNYKLIDNEQFRSDLITELEYFTELNDPIDNLVILFDSKVRDILDHHAPEVVKMRTVRTRFPWYNSTIKEERQVRRKLERKWRKTGSDEDKRAYLDQKNAVNNLIDSEKAKFYQNKFANSDVKGMFENVKTLLNQNTRILPSSDSTVSLCNQFATFFNDKVTTIRECLDLHPGTQSQFVDYRTEHVFSDFMLVFEEDVCKLVNASSTSTCILDPIPTWLMKDHIERFIPSITHIINVSLSSGIFPEPLGKAVISPIIKKSSLDHDELKNYRPVSNVSFISKLIEKVVTQQITNHINDCNLGEIYQSAYKANTSTETALLKVKSDVLNAVDRGKLSFLHF